MPSSILDAPAKGLCPPPFTAKGHLVRRDSSTTVDTSFAVDGLKTQAGRTNSACLDQYPFVNPSYGNDPLVRTLFPKINLRDPHFLICQRTETSKTNRTYSRCAWLRGSPLCIQRSQVGNRGNINTIGNQCLCDIEVSGLKNILCRSAGSQSRQ